MAESIEESILLCSLLYYNEHRNIREEIRTMKRMWKNNNSGRIIGSVAPGMCDEYRGKGIRQ